MHQYNMCPFIIGVYMQANYLFSSAVLSKSRGSVARGVSGWVYSASDS